MAFFVGAKAEWSRQCKLAVGVAAASIPCRRWQAALTAWNWHVGNIGVWSTSSGNFKPAWMSSSAFKRIRLWVHEN